MLQLNPLLDVKNAVHISTHKLPEPGQSWHGKHRIVCGTNILSGNMRQYGLWKLPRNLENYHEITLMGVGFDSKAEGYDKYTQRLLQTILKKNCFHSVRDTFSEKKLKSMGIQNVLYTGCPTMWNLTEAHCAGIPTGKASKVVTTLTDYCRDPSMDKAMLDTLLEGYDKVYLWLQGRDDLAYVRELGYEDKLTLIPSTLADYDTVLALEDLDYVGTRLHAGIRAVSKGHRSLIVSIDNRAECIGADTGLPTIRREDIPIALAERITGKFETKITMPWDNIARWKGQFED